MENLDLPPEPKLPLRYKIQGLFYQMKGLSVLPLLKRAKLKILNQEIVLAGDCSKCGACCSNINLKTAHGWIHSLEDFEALCTQNPDYSRYEPIGMDEDGTLRFHCSWLQKDNTCKDHANRLETCKNYPDKEMLFYNGNLVEGCSYYAQTKRK
jgi:Fe-S-cluster containining protein